jgi:hypothetical protein
LRAGACPWIVNSLSVDCHGRRERQKIPSDTQGAARTDGLRQSERLQSCDNRLTTT